MKRLALIASILVLATSLLAVGPAQEPTFRSVSRTVAIYATVTDSNGRLVPDLEQKHFEVLDNGRPRELSIFKSDVQPITVVVMLDTSGSMTFNIELLKLAAERFVLRLLPEDKARIGSFSDKILIDPRQGFTSDRDELVRILHNDIQFGNPTFLWDAIDVSMDALAHETGRRVVLIFTDGEDDKSRRNNFESVITRASTQDFMIYAIGLQSSLPALRRVTRPDRNLRPLADQTGGGYFELTRTVDLNSTFTRVADELHRQYVLGFSADVLDGTIHKLDVHVKVPGMAVRARKTYLASNNDPSDPNPGSAAAAPKARGGR
jgi:VWFA-related protein